MSLFRTVHENANSSDMNVSLGDQHESMSATSCPRWADHLDHTLRRVPPTPIPVPSLPLWQTTQRGCHDAPQSLKEGSFLFLPPSSHFKVL